MLRHPAWVVGSYSSAVAAHQLPELSEPSQQEVFTKQMCHPVSHVESHLTIPSDSGGEADRHRQRPDPGGRPQRAGADADHQGRPAHRAPQRQLARDRHTRHDRLQVGEPKYLAKNL